MPELTCAEHEAFYMIRKDNDENIASEASAFNELLDDHHSPGR